MNKKFNYKSLIGFIIIGVVLLGNCTKRSPEQMIEKKGGIVFRGVHSKNDNEYFLSFFKRMQEAVANRDLEASFSFYSDKFMNDEGVKLDVLKRNTKILYKNYHNIVYKMTNIRVTIKDNRAVSVDEFSYSAEPIKRGYKKLNYTGTERIYWEKEGDNWKIVNWIFER